MSRSLIDETANLGFYLTQFYGGKDRGTCYQITQANGIYVTLTKTQMRALVNHFIDDILP